VREGRCIGVLGMSPDVTESDIRDILSEFGPIEKVQIDSDKITTQQSKGYAYVIMIFKECAAEV